MATRNTHVMVTTGSLIYLTCENYSACFVFSPFLYRLSLSIAYPRRSVEKLEEWNSKKKKGRWMLRRNNSNIVAIASIVKMSKYKSISVIFSVLSLCGILNKSARVICGFPGG